MVFVPAVDLSCAKTAAVARLTTKNTAATRHLILDCTGANCVSSCSGRHRGLRHSVFRQSPHPKTHTDRTPRTVPRQTFLQCSPLAMAEAGRANQAHAVIPRERGGLRSKRMSSRQELVANASQSIEVVAWIGATALQLLATRISRRSRNSGRRRHAPTANSSP